MPPLDRTLRRGLENAAKAARRVAEQAATKALDSLAVGSHEPWSGQPLADRSLRVKLRERGRQLGDVRDPKTAKQATARLVHEVAYEHWHRMLFARFLAENDLLIEPDSGVAISLDTCRELAEERGTDVWSLASRFAQAMLPEIFRADDPVLAVELAREDQLELEKIVAGLGTEVFTASDSLGWCYQFWQAEKKDSVNASGVKIGADELPAVTQLFTEDYMVNFLLDNTLGAWWAGKVLTADPSIAASAATEEDLRVAVSLTGVPWAYLRFLKGADGEAGGDAGTWRPAAGTFDGWPTATKDLTCLDPCMGSGHFVVGMFERLVPLRMREEELSETAAIQAVIRDNLFGLEIDPRCTQIGAFNLALAAWKRVGHCPLPAMHIACSGLAPNATEEEWVALAEGNSRLEEGMRRLHGLFQDAPVLGSLINPRAGGLAAFEAPFADLQPILEKALAKEGSDEAEHELAVTARGVAKAAEILGGQFTLVATNVPYLSVNKHSDALRRFGIHQHPDARHDLATIFVERYLAVAATAAFVSPQNWLFQPRYKKLRQRLLKEALWHTVAALGPGAFETITGEVVKAILVTISDSLPTPEATLWGIDLASVLGIEEKSRGLQSSSDGVFSQHGQVSNPDSRVVLAGAVPGELLLEIADSRHGIRTADGFRLLRAFWELPGFDSVWIPEQSTPEATQPFAGRDRAIRWDGGAGPLKELAGLGLASLQGGDAWGKQGIVVSLMGKLPVTRYSGELFDNNCAALWPKKLEDLSALWVFCATTEFHEYVRRIDKKLNVTSATLLKIPFDRLRWEGIAAAQYPDGLPKPFSSDPTQWLFNGHPKGSDNPLQVAVARLVGYRWPRQTGSEFPDCPALGPDGLEAHADADGIVCLSSVRGEQTAADRLLALLADAYGADWTADVRDKLLDNVDAAGKTLDDWLRDSFFEQHVDLFHKRPFVWHIWDGLRDGFNCLVNYHQLAGPDGQGRRTLEKVAYEYLGDWITRQKAQQTAGEEGADARVAAAVHLQEQLAKIIEGEPPFDIFVRWKPLAEQPLGWEPDINDGVRLNIRPFMTAKPLGGPGKGKGKGKTAKSACILRTTPGIKWDKDRGSEPDRPKDHFPWFWTWDGETADFVGGREFDGNRHNDLHYSRKVKDAARAKATGSGTKPAAVEARK
jgi:hypothetical protein